MDTVKMDTEKKTILIADDVDINRDMLRIIFEEQFNVLEAADGYETISMLDTYQDEIVLLFLDFIMPGKNGLEVMKYMKDKGYMNTIPVIMITGEATTETDIKAYEYGASDIMRKPFTPKIVMRRTLNILELFENRLKMEQKLSERTKELVAMHKKLRKNNDFLINALSSVLEFRSLESSEHIKRVRYFTHIILDYVKKFHPEYNLTDELISSITDASALHDLGKIAIPDNILLKPGKLTKEEYEEMKKHTTYGCKLLENFKQEDSEFYNLCYDICRHHHERYDGKGYPDGLVGDEISIWSQVVSIVDVYDALISERIYKLPYAEPEAVRMIHEGECGAFSPVILECFDLARTELFEASESLSHADFHHEP